eukprot:681993-Hanusia_phi.AAC.1
MAGDRPDHGPPPPRLLLPASHFPRPASSFSQPPSWLFLLFCPPFPPFPPRLLLSFGLALFGRWAESNVDKLSDAEMKEYCKIVQVKDASGEVELAEKKLGGGAQGEEELAGAGACLFALIAVAV